MNPSVKIALVLVFLVSSLDIAHATIIDFENIGLTEGDFVTTIDGVTFDNAFLIKKGNPTRGFNGNSSGSGVGGPDDANTGDSIGAKKHFDPVIVRFDTAVGGIFIDLLDIEVGSSFIEEIQLRLYSGLADTTPLHTTTVRGNDGGAGDGTAITVDLSSFDNILRMEIERVDVGSAGTIPGFGIDNLVFTASASGIPEPATLALMSIALTYLGFFQKKLRVRSM